MDILYVTSEAAPFSASGGLGDVMGALPQAVKSASPEDRISVILPYYKKKVPENLASSFKLVTEFRFKYVWRDSYAGIYSTERGGVTYYFVDNEQYFMRDGLYGEFDDGERFAFFSTAVVEFLFKLDKLPDVIHANDWQSALTVVYLRTKYYDYKPFRSIKTVYTIHNIEYQGKYDLAILG
ncbi:MAG: glycogen/starch synthase, partial [Clostridia bacterium]|nr:glycogen/starch synthase [Clostridia bacterium]